MLIAVLYFGEQALATVSDGQFVSAPIGFCQVVNGSTW